MTISSRWARAHRTALVDRVTVATRTGGGGLGSTYAAERTVLGYARTERDLVRGADADTSGVALTLRLPPTVVAVDELDNPVDGAPLDAAALFAPGSRVTAAGVTGLVRAVAVIGKRGRAELVTVTAD